MALWGDALVPLEPGHVALISQSGNLAVNALSARRGLRLHTVVSCGNQAVLEAADYLLALRARTSVRSVALNLEDDGDGAKLCEALAACADAGSGWRCSRSAPRRRERRRPPPTPAPSPATSGCSPR